jgi:hypothetical protein
MWNLEQPLTLHLEVSPMNFKIIKSNSECKQIMLDIRSDSDARDSERIKT